MATNNRKGVGGEAAAIAIEPAGAMALPAGDSSAGGSVKPLVVAAVTGPARPANKPLGLAANVADAAAAKLLISDELPEGEKPSPGNRMLLVGLVWGGSTLVELEQIGKGSDLPVKHLFDLPASHLARNFPIVRHVGEGHVLTLPSQIKVEVHGKGQLVPLSQRGRRVDAPFPGYAYEIVGEDRLVAQIAPHLTLISRYVRAARRAEGSVWKGLDLPFAATLILAIVAFAIFFFVMARTKVNEKAMVADAAQSYQPYVRTTRPAPKEVEPPKSKDASGVKEGDKAQGDEGKLGKQEAKKKEAAPSKKGAPAVDPNAKKKADLAKIKKLGLISALSRMGAGGSATGKVLGPGGLGTGINNSLGGTKGHAGVGDAYGVGGTGTRGTGTGGGGNALGIGGLGTKGTGHGRGGIGDVDLGGKGKEETVFIPGKTTVVGGLSRDVINRVIQKHYNEIKYCYEKELARDPALYGKVTMLFVIGGTGRVDDALVQQTTMANEAVEGCMVNHVKRWAFPQPQGGGTVQVTYPYVFKASGQ